MFYNMFCVEKPVDERQKFKENKCSYYTQTTARIEL